MATAKIQTVNGSKAEIFCGAKNTTRPLTVWIGGTEIERGLFSTGKMCYTWVRKLINKYGLKGSYQMNFIDKAFDNNLHGDDFLQAMAEIYSESEVRQMLNHYPQFVKDIILIIDYDTAIQMDGLGEVICGGLEKELPEILQALDNCGAGYEADILRKAKAMTQEKFEEEYANLYSELAINNDYDGFWDLVRRYIDTSLQV